MAQLSTSLSDGFLALSALHACSRLIYKSVCGALGFALVGAAAVCGIFRFGIKSPSSRLVSQHKYMSWIASVLGMSLLAAAYYRQENMAIFANGHVALALALVILQRYLAESVCSMATEIVSGLAVISMFILNIFQFNAYGFIGAGLYIFSGLVVKTEGEIYCIPRVDIFHYLLVIANISLMLGLSETSAPIYYKPSVIGG